MIVEPIVQGRELEQNTMRPTKKNAQRQLAERLDITSTSVARMERGEQKIMQVTTLAVRYLQGMESKTKGKKK